MLQGTAGGVVFQIPAEHVQVDVAGVAQGQIPRNVERQQQVPGAPQGVLPGQRLRHHHVQGRPGDAPGVQGLHQGLLVDGGAPAHVHHNGVPGQQGNALPAEDAHGVRHRRQSHHQDLRLRQHLVQLLLGQHPVIGGVRVPAAAGHAADVSRSQGLGPPGEIGADVPGSQHRDAAAVNGPHRQLRHPFPPPDDVLELRHPPQQHQRHHEDVLADGEAVGSGGVGQHHVGAGVQAVVGQLVHPGEAAAVPLQPRGPLQVLGIAPAVNDLILLQTLGRGRAPPVKIHRKAALFRRIQHLFPALRRQEVLHHRDFSHLPYTSHIFSAQRMPSAAADRMPPA